jgi:hypothetical protein
MISLETLKKIATKYGVTTSGTKPQLASRLLRLRSHVMNLSDLNTVEDFLKVIPSKRYKGPRYSIQKDGNLRKRNK